MGPIKANNFFSFPPNSHCPQKEQEIQNLIYSCKFFCPAFSFSALYPVIVLYAHTRLSTGFEN